MIILAGILAIYGLYLLAAAYLSRGIRYERGSRIDTPSISLIVPARNEEACLSDLLDSLLNVDYPADCLQIIIVNDQSTDRTREIALSYQDRFLCRYEVHDVVDEPDGKLVLKTRPLAQGMDRATGEIVLMTDADCVVPAAWIRTVASHFAPGVGMVCGTTLPHPRNHSIFPLTPLETLDWLFLLGATTALSGKGQPQALIGNNYSVLREAYLDVGTFRSLSFSDLDDIALMQALKQARRWKVIFPADSGVQLYTRPLRSFFDLIRQRRRWMKGVIHVDPLGKAVLSFGIITHVMWPLWPVFFGEWFFLPWILLAVGDGFVLTRMLHHHRHMHLLPLIPFYPLFAGLYGIGMVTLMLTQRRVPWKERKF